MDKEARAALRARERLNNMHLKEVLEEKVEAFQEWDEESPRNDHNVHAYFDLETISPEKKTTFGRMADAIFEDHQVKWYCGRCRWGYRITNRRERDGSLILTLKECEDD